MWANEETKESKLKAGAYIELQSKELGRFLNSGAGNAEKHQQSEKRHNLKICNNAKSVTWSPPIILVSS